MFEFRKNKKNLFKYHKDSENTLANEHLIDDISFDEDDEDYYIQISFDTEPEPEPEITPDFEEESEIVPEFETISDTTSELESEDELESNDLTILDEEYINIENSEFNLSNEDFNLYNDEVSSDEILPLENDIEDNTSIENNIKGEDSTISDNELTNDLYLRYRMNNDLEKTINDIISNKNKAIKKSILISTIISSLLTTSAIGGYHYIFNNEPAKTNIVINSEGKNTNVYKAVATKGTPSVVGITTLTIDTNNFLNLPMQTEGVGSGVIINNNGYILTNSHVVDDGNATKVSVLFADGTSIDGQVLWNDASLDLAIVKVDKKNLDVAELGDSDELEVGDIAIAIGNPIGLELNKSVTQGIISGKDRSLATSKGSMTGLIQTDASINPGNSGGPLLNEKGQVIGINTAKLSDSEGLGFAIPINVAKPIVEQIITKGDFEKVSLGIKGVDVSNVKTYLGLDLPTDDGVYVIEVNSQSPANVGGIKTGDTILAIDEHKISSMSDLNKILYSYRKGDSAKAKIMREGKEYVLDINFSQQISTINSATNSEPNITENIDVNESLSN